MSAVQELETRALSVPERAKTATIQTGEDYERAGELLKTVKGLRAEIDSTFDPIITAAHKAHKEALEQKKKVEAPLAEAENLLKPKIAAYLAEEERKRREEELRLQKLAQEEAERRRLEEAAMLDDIGETAEANAILEEPVFVPAVTVQPTAPKVAGITMRTTWAAQVTDLVALVKGVASGKVPIQALKADQTFLNQQARAMKSALSYPGVRAVPDNNISARR